MDIATLLKLGESYGPVFLIFIVLVFFIWLQHQTHMKQLGIMQERENKVYEQNSNMLAVLQQLVAQQSRIETKIESNQFCPITRQGAGK